MKRILLLMLLCMFSTIAMAQTTWTGLGANTNWNNTDNWDTNAIPTASDDVIIPTGFTVTLNVPGTVQSIDVQGNSTFIINTNLVFSQPSVFATGTTINWNIGTFTGASTTLTNNGTINMFSSNIGIGASTTLLNQGQINLNGGGDIFISVDGLLDNTSSGTISMLANVAGISQTGAGNNQFNNNGLIIVDLPEETNQVTINCEFNNNDSTIQVNSGILNFTNPSIGSQVLTDGTYNVAAGSAIELDNEITLTGSLDGTLDGNFVMRSNVRVNNGDSASFDFTGNAVISWVTGQLVGEGNLINNNTINTFASNVTIGASTTLTNQGQINTNGGGDIFISVDGLLNNTPSGTISFLASATGISQTGTGTNQFDNNGLLIVDLPDTSNQATINCEFNNNDSTIQVNSGILNLTNASIGSQVLSGGTYNVVSGSALDLDNEITLTGSLSGNLDGNLNMRSNVRVNNGDTASFDFTGNATVSWVTGQLVGEGNLINNSTINTFGSNVTIGASTTLTNQGQLNISGGGDILIAVDAILNNSSLGVVSMLSNAGGISQTGTGTNLFDNNGLIVVDLPNTSDQVGINCEFNNNDSTIQVNSGILNLTNSSIGSQVLSGGTYNVVTGSALELDNEITITGSLSGTLDGSFVMRSNIRVNGGDSASFDFTGNAAVSWSTGQLIGGGTLINNVTINTGVSNVTIATPSLLLNNGFVNLTGGGDILIAPDAILRNSSTGVIDFQSTASGISQSGAGINLLDNQGLLKNTSSTTITISAETQNSGIIEATTGTLNFSNVLDNLEGGVFTGVTNIDIPVIANFTNSGNVAPGLSPGTLTIIGDFISSETSQLDVELNGLTPDTEHDVLAISGNNVVFEGIVNPIMGFEGTVGDEFVIATVTGTIATGNLQSPIGNVDFDGKRYTFEVSYPDNNKVVLTIIDKLDILPPDVVTQNILVQLDASGNASILPSEIDNGSSDNCTPTNELQFSLDVDTFDCSNLGDNNINLTVTDNDGNSASAPATVIVEDVINPSVVTQNITVQLDASGNASILPSEIDNGSSDNCSVADLSIDISEFTCSDLGDNTITLTVTDQSGNVASETAVVTVEDTTSPTVVTQNIIVELDASGSVSVLASEIDNGSSDNCSVVDLNLDITEFTCTDLGDNTVTLTVTDASGNTAFETALVTVEDSSSPTAVTQNLTVQLDASGNAGILASEVDNGSSDNCSVADLSIDISEFTCADLGENTVTLTVTDQSGNVASETTTVTVEDTINPEISCPAGITIETTGDYEIPNFFIEGDVTASDNCGFTVEQNLIPGTLVPDGEYEVIMTVTDDAGNTSTCSFDLKVEDTTLSSEQFQLTDQNIVLYPNPVNNILYLKNKSALNLTEVEIFDVTGKIINKIDAKAIADTVEISMVNLANGVYFLRINADNSTITKRIIKQ